jgi:hypothetical protein
MTELPHHFIELPFIFMDSFVEFLFWDMISGYRWKQRDVQPTNLVKPWQDHAVAAARELREQRYKSHREMEELESKYRKILKQKEREISLSQRS